MAARVDHRQCRRQRAFRLVVVGYHQVDAQFPGPLPRFPASYPAVDCHYDAHAHGVQPLYRCGLQSVSVTDSLRYEVHDFTVQHLDHAPQDDGRRDAVDIVVAVHGNPFTPRDGGEQAVHAGLQVREQKRVVKLVE